MNMLLALLAPGDYVGFTFFIGSMAMLAATVFFFAEMRNVEGKWKTSLLVSGLITMIAAVHYYYMRDFWIATQTSPTEFRYIDWILTVPLMCVEFYLILRAFGATTALLAFRCGAATAARMALTGQTISADQAHGWGLCGEPVDAKQIWVSASELAAQCGEAPREAIQANKRLLNECVGEMMLSQLAAGAAGSATACTTESAREGILAFLEARDPVWPT